MYSTYILQSESADRLYIGQTNNLTSRIIKHNSGKDKMILLDKCFDILKSFNSDINPNYTKHFVGITIGNRPNNFIGFYPKKKFLKAHVKVSDKDKWKNRVIESGIDFISLGRTTVRIRLNAVDFENRIDLVKSLFDEAYKEWMS